MSHPGGVTLEIILRAGTSFIYRTSVQKYRIMRGIIFHAPGTKIPQGDGSINRLPVEIKDAPGGGLKTFSTSAEI